MPCGDNGETEGRYKEEISRLTRIACELEKHVQVGAMLTKETYDWIMKHRETDRQRLEKEALKESAIRKLTAEERKALGFK